MQALVAAPLFVIWQRSRRENSVSLVGQKDIIMGSSQVPEFERSECDTDSEVVVDDESDDIEVAWSECAPR